MKLTDYVADYLSRMGIKHVFGVTGGAIAHLFDSVSRLGKIQPIFHHHEQTAAFAAQAYTRITENLGVAFVTTGPGGTNAITGLSAAWLDSIPCLFISGQTRIEHTTHNKPIRQLGAQQLDIISIVKPLTKYAVLIEDPKTIRYHLEKAVYIARTGRPGPVWIDIPLNFQWASIDPDTLSGFKPEGLEKLDSTLRGDVKECLRFISQAKRPLILAGHGIRLAHATEEFKEFISISKIPFVSSWNASDILPTNHRCYIGRLGIAGQRGANLAVQNCDFLLVIGSHLSIPLSGTRYDVFAREARKMIVDIDPVELTHEAVKVDKRIQSDAKEFLKTILEEMKRDKIPSFNWWQEKCLKFKTYNTIPKEWHKQKQYVNPYVFIDVLSDELGTSDVIVVDGGGTVVYISFQAFRVKRGQRFILSSGLCAMGSGLPESIGACFANNQKRTICFCGDGSMQFNIQELQTIVHHKLPVKIIIFNNNGYLSIRHTQGEFLGNRFVGSQTKGGLSLPDYLKIAKAYGVSAVRIRNHMGMQKKIKDFLKKKGPAICEIMISPKQEVIPRLGFKKNPDGSHSGKPLEDMCPNLDRNEFLENMIVEPLPESKE